MRYRLIATDLDGTLLNERKEITPRTRGVMQQLQERGALVVLSTARPPRGVLPLYRSLGLTGPLIAYNGAMVYDPGRGAPLLHHPLARHVALGVMAAIRAVDPSLNVGLEMADQWHVDRIDDRLKSLLAFGESPTWPSVGGLEEAIAAPNPGVSKLYFIAPPDRRQAFEEQLCACGLREEVTVTSSGADFVEILAQGVSKGAALRALAALLGIPREETVALGDEENDIPALQEAGLSIAMANGAERVRQAASVVTGPNTADGWAEAIERYVLAG